MACGVPSPNLSPAKRSREGFQQPQHENHRIEAEDRLMDARLEKKSCPRIAVELTTQATGRHAGRLAVTSFAGRSHAPSGSDQPEDVPVRVRLPKGIVLQTDELASPAWHRQWYPIPCLDYWPCERHACASHMGRCRVLDYNSLGERGHATTNRCLGAVSFPICFRQGSMLALHRLRHLPRGMDGVSRRTGRLSSRWLRREVL